MIDHFEPSELQTLLVNAGEDFDAAWGYLSTHQLGAPCLLDEDGQVYGGYPYDGEQNPFPLYVVVDREGAIVWLSRDADAASLRGAIQGAIDG